MAFKNFLLVLYVTNTVKTSGDYELSDYIRNVSHTACPFTNYCSKTPETLNNEMIIPCCSDCSCDASTCYQTENCCPDIEPKPDKTSDFICADTMTKDQRISSTFGTHNGHKYGIKRYYIITSCPKDFKDEFVDSKCKGDNKTDVDDFLWVSRVENSDIYQNYHCAICHGVENWVTWNIRTNCYDRLIETGFKNTAATLLSDDCEIINEVPESKADDSRIYRCYLPDFTSCERENSK